MAQAGYRDALGAHARRLAQSSIEDLNRRQPGRAQQLALRVGPLYANFARQSYDQPALDALWAYGQSLELPQAFRRLFDGAPVNLTEARPALHTALRSDLGRGPVAAAARAQVLAAEQRLAAIVAELEASSITDIVSIGIGGSDLGPRLVCDALKPLQGARFAVHFVSNIDGMAIERVLAGLDPARTAGILISKSFTTQETLSNGAILQRWLGDAGRLYAVSADVQRPQQQFGIAAERVLPMWDWVGGRYSLWSAVGLPIALALGMDAWRQLHEGAALVDAHVLQAPLQQNLPFLHGLTEIWNRNACGHASHAVMCYDARLVLLPAYLQQLVMESLGKQVGVDGRPVRGHTVPIWWGGAGTDVQHSFFQALHQGTQMICGEFIGCVRGDDPHPLSHQALLANLLAQTQSLANGQPSADLQRNYPGGRPTTTVLLDALTPYSLGALIAMYEHSVYVQSLAWGINAFDQFGVELGKQVASALLPAVRDRSVTVDDPVTAELLAQLHR